jgi:parallel beta-helix repeat protein
MAVGALLAVTAAGCATGATGDPVNVTGTQVQVSGQVMTSTGGDVEYWAEYGLTTAYGSQTAHQTAANVPANASRSVFPTITGLDRSTTYHYRICAQDSQQQGGPGCGADKQFTTVNVDCGDTLTADTHLSGDLDCFDFGRPGLTIGADAIVVDLGSHTVVASGPAVDNGGGHNDVTIRDGSLGSLGTVVVLSGASRNRLVRLNVGVAPPGGVFFEASRGITIDSGQANVIRDTHAAAAGDGIEVHGSPGLVVNGATASGGRSGFGMVLAADLARIRDSSFTSSFISGLLVQGSSNHIVASTGAAQGGIIRVDSGSGNVVAENQLHDGAVGGSGGEQSGDGLFVGANAAGTVVRANVASGNAGDGIDVESASTRLKDNTANDNGDLGIEAVPGVIDLGGNTASGNGNPLQCQNVFCQ